MKKISSSSVFVFQNTIGIPNMRTIPAPDSPPPVHQDPLTRAVEPGIRDRTLPVISVFSVKRIIRKDPVPDTAVRKTYWPIVWAPASTRL